MAKTTQKKGGPSRAAAKPRSKATAKRSAATTKPRRKKAATKGAPKAIRPTEKKRKKVRASTTDEADMPKFAVAFIDTYGQEHLATALAPDPGVALAGLLEKAAEFEEPWLDDLVAVVVSHPSTWQSVRERVLDVFEP